MFIIRLISRFRRNSRLRLGRAFVLDRHGDSSNEKGLLSKLVTLVFDC